MSTQLDMVDIFSGNAAPTGPSLSGRDLRDSGIEEAYQRALRVKRDYVEKCLSAIRSFPSGTLLTSEDIREKAGDPPSVLDKSVMAGILKNAASKEHGLIVITGGERAAKRPSVHSKNLSLWRRL